MHKNPRYGEITFLRYPPTCHAKYILYIHVLVAVEECRSFVPGNRTESWVHEWRLAPWSRSQILCCRVGIPDSMGKDRRGIQSNLIEKVHVSSGLAPQLRTRCGDLVRLSARWCFHRANFSVDCLAIDISRRSPLSFSVYVSLLFGSSRVKFRTGEVQNWCISKAD